jgi:hypothetical protein
VRVAVYWREEGRLAFRRLAKAQAIREKCGACEFAACGGMIAAGEAAAINAASHKIMTKESA